MEYSIIYDGKVLDANNLELFKETRRAPFRVMFGEASLLCQIVPEKFHEETQALTEQKYLTIGELAAHVSQGCTFSPAVQEGGKWKCQDIVILEFYNQKKCTMLDYIDYGSMDDEVEPVMIVPMRPGRLDSDSFYFVFISSTPIESLEALRQCENNLWQMYPRAEHSPQNPIRFYSNAHDFVYVSQANPVDLLTL